METRARSIVKAIIWNMIGLLMMCFVGYVATGSLTVGGAMAVVNAVIGLTCYVIYERVWAQVSWGRHA
ncbi:MAG: DUF2061 domain-containing protein [Cognatishimia activa]|uniref:DUF2061 domain-containing protein n=1 Tax=Cognatishimia activa TaxID=1715691 RepID=A0A975I7M5_9RHOB|nr:DUF2061 domain-containing protein [Cognatishimia activa]QTN36162.1 DUF2061 domain-containing protein [Cognatishimia activa]